MSPSQVVLVTGCSRGGIGYALCEQYAAQGCNVYATARSVEKLEGLPKDVHKLRLDVCLDEDVDRAIKEIVEEAGRIDIVVNNAGELAIAPLLEVPLQRVKDAFDTNTFSALRVARAAFPHMAERKRGLIVNIGSISGHIGTPWGGLYCASKAALGMLSDVMDMECRPFNIRVMLVAPGSIRSNISTNQAATLTLPDTSLYKRFLPNIVDRMHASQTSSSMPAAVFASKLVQATLQKNPPRYFSIGDNARLFSFLRWLPRALVLLFMWRRFSRPLKP